MSDYKSVPFNFALMGLNLAVPPELVKEGYGTRMLNIRPTIEGRLEGRPGTDLLIIPQPELAGYEFPYPTFWDLGPMSAIRYIGKVTDSDGNPVDGYLTIHSSSTYSGLYYFINGMPLIRKYCDSTSTGTTKVFQYATKLSIPSGTSIVRASAKNGVPIVLIDGKYFVRLNQVKYATPDATNANDGSVASGINLGDVPGIYAWTLGAPVPTLTSVASSGSAGTGITASTAYSYRITWYDSMTGFESPPSAAVSYTTDSTPNKPRLTWNKPDPNTVGNCGMDTVRIWRTGGTISDYRLVGSTTLVYQTCALGGGTTTYDDDASEVSVALAELLDVDLVQPFTSITSTGASSTGQQFSRAFGPFNGKTVFWVGDPVRKNVVYWNSGGNLSLTDPIDDNLSVSDAAEELLNGFVFGGSPYMWSRKKLYQLVYNGEDTIPRFTPQEIPLGIGSVGQYSFAVGINKVAVCAADGIYLTACQPDTPICITDDTLKPLFRGIKVGDIEAVDFNQSDDIKMALTTKDLHFFYKGADSGDTFHLVFDMIQNRWFQWTTETYVTGYVNEAPAWNQILFGHRTLQQAYVLDDVFSTTSETFTVRTRSGAFSGDLPLRHKEFGGLMLDFDPDGADITIIPYYNSEVNTGVDFATGTQNDFDGRRVKTFSLSDVYGKSLSLDFSWTETPGSHPKLYQANILYRDDEEAIVHWEHPETNLGQDSWFHIRDTFWALRSTADVTLTVTVDGHIDTYTLPSTSGARRKVYMELKPRRGKVVRFALDSSAPFRFYGGDSTLFVKRWKTGDGYEKLSPFVGA